MLIGIDVGGTFTDGVLYDDRQVLATVKAPTNESCLKESLLQVLDNLLRHAKASEITRLVLSTTLITNLIATGRGERTALALFPGYGLPHNSYTISEDTFFFKGSIDFRGSEIELPDQNEITAFIDWINQTGVKRIAIAGKFSNRNNKHERALRERILKNCKNTQVSISSELSSQLNMPRRAATAYFTAMTLSDWNRFADEIEAAIKARGIDAELHVLKADGGTMLLAASRKAPLETVFSGPAASTMGALALTMDKINSVVIDIGGTTTDLSLIIEGEPLYASKGAKIANMFTHVNALAIRSIALGGDSVVNEGGIQNFRQGPAACVGGSNAAVTDAFNLYYNLGLGDSNESQRRLDAIAASSQQTTEILCKNIVDTVTHNLENAIKEMFTEWEKEPAYKVWEIINQKKFKPERIIGIGAAAQAIIPALAPKMGLDSFIHLYSPVANALGAAVVRPTLAVYAHVDTQKNTYTLNPGGVGGSVPNPGKFQLKEAQELARSHLYRLADDSGIGRYATEADFFMEEQFNMIRGWERAGKIFDVGIQISPGFIDEFEGVKR